MRPTPLDTTPRLRTVLAACALATAALAGPPNVQGLAGGGVLSIEARDGKVTPRGPQGLSAASLDALGAIAVRFDGFPPPEPPGLSSHGRAEVALSSGDRLIAAVAGGDGDALGVTLLGGVRVEVLVDQLSRVVFPARIGAGAIEPAASGDRLYWTHGGSLDRLDGTLEAFEAQGVSFDSVLGRRTFPWNEVAALFVEELGAGAEESSKAGQPVAVDLIDGGRVHARLEKLDEAGARLRWNGEPLQLPLAALREITVDDGSVAFLSRTPPARAVEGWPSGDEIAGGDDDIGMRWPYQLDRAVTGGPLGAGGKTWSRGIGVHSPSRLEWTLDGGWSELRGLVAVDDSVLLLGYRGSVEFSIRLDGQPEPAWRSGRVRGGDAPVALPPIALKGVRKLELIVDMDERSFVADRANWLRMLLLR